MGWVLSLEDEYHQLDLLPALEEPILAGVEQVHFRVMGGGSMVKTLVVAEENWLQLQVVAMLIELPLEQGELGTMVA
jgi:hypothetical protein